MFERRVLIAAVALVGLLAATGCRPVGRVSVPRVGGRLAPTSAASWEPSTSGDGRSVAFTSDAADLVAGDTNGTSDVFVRDLGSGTTRRVNVVTGTGGQSSGPASEPAISGDGRFVAFTSSASDLVAGDSNGAADVFVHDRVAGTTERVSVTGAGGQSTGPAGEPAISGDGRFVAFSSSASDLVAGDSNGASDVFVRDRVAGTTTRVSVTEAGAQASGASTSPSISASGDWVAFASVAANLVGGDTNGVADVFVARRTGGTVRRSSAPDPLSFPLQQANGASARPRVVDPIGGYPGSGDPLVAYESRATNLVSGDGNGSGSDVFVTTYLFGSVARTVRVSQGATEATDASLGVVDGGPGFVVGYVRSTDGIAGDIVSVERPSPIATDGLDPRVVDVGRGGQADGPGSQPSVSADGRFVAFHSTAGNLAGRDEGSTLGDVYVGRSLQVRVNSIEPSRVGVGETRDLTITGAGFEPTSRVRLGHGVSVDAVTFVSSTELVVTVTVHETTPGDPWRDVLVRSWGAGGSLLGSGEDSCGACVEIAAVVEQPGPVGIEITGGTIQIGALALPVPGCTAGACLALPADVTADGVLSLGIESVEIAPIPIPVELIPGVETTIEIVPALVAPRGTVVPATGAVSLDFGFALKLRNPLLPAACAIGPVQVAVSAGPGGDALGNPYDQFTGEAVLAGGFTEELAVTGCGFIFTPILNNLLGFPLPIADNSVSLGIRFDPILTGTAVP